MLEGVGSEYTHGHVQDDEEPEYGDLTYLAMVWCAGVAIGLIFYGVSEPLTHSVDASNKYNNNGYFNENEMAINGLHITLFHWGFLAWIVYAITALTMGFLSYRKGLPLCFRSTLAPLFGKATWGWMGDLLDVLTIVTIVAGLCTSLGLGARQIVGGLQRLEWLDGTLTEDRRGPREFLAFADVLRRAGCVALGFRLRVCTAYVSGRSAK